MVHPVLIADAINRLDVRQGRVSSLMAGIPVHWSPEEAEAFLRRSENIVETIGEPRAQGYTVSAFGARAVGALPRWVQFAATEIPRPTAATERVDNAPARGNQIAEQVLEVADDVFKFPGHWASLVWGGNDERPSRAEYAALIIDILTVARRRGLTVELDRRLSTVTVPASQSSEDLHEAARTHARRVAGLPVDEADHDSREGRVGWKPGEVDAG